MHPDSLRLCVYVCISVCGVKWLVFDEVFEVKMRRFSRTAAILLLLQKKKQRRSPLKGLPASTKRILWLLVVIKWITTFWFFKRSYFLSSVWINVKAITSYPVWQMSCKQKGLVKKKLGLMQWKIPLSWVLQPAVMILKHQSLQSLFD